MPIKVSCHCGQSFTAKDNLAGQTLLCPKCSQPLTIPSPDAPAAKRQVSGSSIGELLEEVGLKEHRGPRCPQCNEPLLKPDAVICTACGYHLQTGEKLQAAKVYKSGERGHAEATETWLERAAQQIEIDKVEQKKNQSQGLPAWMYFIALTALTAFVITMFTIPRDRAFMISGWCLIGFAALMEMYYGIRIIISAFGENATCGLLYLFMPFYALYYLATRWDKVGALFLMQLLFGLVSGFGFIMLALAPSMAKDKDQPAAWLNRPHRAHTVAVASQEPGCATLA